MLFRLSKSTKTSLSYTFGGSIKESILTSAGRISKIQPFPDVKTIAAKEIIHKRAALGLFHSSQKEGAANVEARRIIPGETITAILKRFRTEHIHPIGAYSRSDGCCYQNRQRNSHC